MCRQHTRLRTTLNARHLKIGVPGLMGRIGTHQIVTVVSMNTNVTRLAAAIVLKVMNKYQLDTRLQGALLVNQASTGQVLRLTNLDLKLPVDV